MHTFLARQAPAWLPEATGAPLTSRYLVGLGVGLWLLSQLLEAHLRHVAGQLTPVHPLITHGYGRHGTDEEAPTTALVDSHARPPYESKKLRKGANKHQGLFLLGRHGPVT